ncbi:aminopeptidase N [Luteococcus sp.]|uniref:aminopeptidase N n=1 Tax=Luteococcus sp. TaxID=1969402 RepID=UPI003735349A
MSHHSSLRHEQAQERSGLLLVAEVDVHLDLREAARQSTFTSTTRISFDCTRPGAETVADLRCEELLRLRLNGTQLEPQWVDGRLLLPGLQAHNVLEVEARMAFSGDGEGLHRHIDAQGETYLYAMSFLDAAPRWFCCFDQPDLKMRLRLVVEAPEEWIVRGNSPATRLTDGSWQTERTAPISTYLATVVAGPWVELRRAPEGQPGQTAPELGLLARRELEGELRRDAEELFALTGRLLPAYRELFGVDYPFGDYLQVFVPDFNAGAMEDPGCVLLREQFLHRGQATAQQRAGRASTIAHELAHQWFGDLVTPHWWDDLWLNESFAEFLGHEIGARVGLEDLWLGFGLDRKPWGSAADQGPSTHPVAGNGADDAAAALASFDGISYAKGAAVLRQLLAWMGADAFWDGLREHIRRHAFATATMADLVDCWRAQGVEDLDEWLEAWLGTTGQDRLQAVVLDGRVEVCRQAARPRPHRLRVAVHDEDGRLLDSQQLTVKAERTTTRLVAGAGQLVLLDPDDLCWARLRPLVVDGRLTDAPMAALEPASARSMLLQSLVDQVRSAECDPMAALEMMLRAATHERSDRLLVAELSRALDWANQWSPPAERAGRRARVAAVARELLRATEAGSDRALGLRRILASASDEPEELRGLLGEADGKHPQEHPRPLGPDDRWTVVRRMVALGQPEEVVEAELERDPSSAGQRAARTARAARPDASSRREVLQRVLTSDAPASQVQADAAGLFAPEHSVDPSTEELTRELARGWWRGIEATARLRTGWGLAQCVKAGIPWTVADAQTLAVAREAVESCQEPTVRRVLADALDELGRRGAAMATGPVRRN